MSSFHSSKILKLAALKPLDNEPDTLVRNHDGTLISVMEAPLIRALAKGLGVTFNIVMPKDDFYGEKKPDGTWDGIMGMVISGVADLSGCHLYVTKERTEAVNFSYPLHATDITFMTDKPKPNPKGFSIFDAFSFEVWVGIGLCVILMSFLLYILLKRRKTFTAVLIETIGCLLDKSFSFHVRQRNTSVLLLFWFLGITILTNSYKSIILSVITIPKMVGIRDITGLSEAAKENSTMCMKYKGLILWQRESNDDRLNTIGECLKRADKESLYTYSQFVSYAHKKAFISSRFDLNNFSRDYFISENSFSLTHDAIAYSKQFCCPEELNGVVHSIVAAGLYQKMIKDRYYLEQLRRLKIKNDNYDRIQWRPLTVKAFTGAFFVLIIGHVFSFFIFITEIIAKSVLH